MNIKRNGYRIYIQDEKQRVIKFFIKKSKKKFLKYFFDKNITG
jgi:hypothetical protein